MVIDVTDDFEKSACFQNGHIDILHYKTPPSPSVKAVFLLLKMTSTTDGLRKQRRLKVDPILQEGMINRLKRRNFPVCVFCSKGFIEGVDCSKVQEVASLY